MDRVELARRLGAEAMVGEPAEQPRVIAESEPRAFMAAFAAAVAAGGEVFLADPNWGAREREEMAEMLARERERGTGRGGRGWLMIPSGGTSGRLKFARHDEETIAAAVRGFCGHFGVERVKAVGVLPLYHVSGFMAWMRCVFTGGEYRAWEWREMQAGQWPALPGSGEWVISLVPTQLQRLLASAAAVEWLRGFRAIFVGGGPAWAELLEMAARAGVRVALSYGMTETAAMVTALRPEEFATGARSSGTALPHARVRVDAEGGVVVGGASLFRGYWPAWREGDEWETGDWGQIDERGQLHVLGRRDAVIITGGKKVQPLAVEAALRGSGEFEDVVVLGVPDAEWGEAVVAFYPAGQRAPEVARAGAGLAPWERPKRWVAVESWPRNAQGKVDRAALKKVVSGQRSAVGPPKTA